MLTPYYATLMSSQIDGPSATLGAGITILPKQAIYTFPAQFFQFIGQMIRIRAAGRITTAASAPGTALFSVTNGTTAIFSQATWTPTVSITNGTWILDLTLTVRALDTNAAAGLTFITTGTFISAASPATAPVLLVPLTAPAVGSAWDNSATNVCDLWITWGTASTNTIICHQYQLDAVL
jgi:hypothetical protein